MRSAVVLSPAPAQADAPALWLETAEWWLYAVHPQFAEAYARFHVRNRKHLHMAMTQAPEVELPGHWEMELPRRAAAMQQGQAVHLVGFAKGDDSGEIGCLNSYWAIEHGDFQACTISFMVDERLQGRGLMYGAASAAIVEVVRRHQLHRVMATHLPENLRSARLLRRLGFLVEGYARDFVRINGQWRDNVLLSLLLEDQRPPATSSVPPVT